jgi:hypothetical protein
VSKHQKSLKKVLTSDIIWYFYQVLLLDLQDRNNESRFVRLASQPQLVSMWIQGSLMISLSFWKQLHNGISSRIINDRTNQKTQIALDEVDIVVDLAHLKQPLR